tara:strand:+ start:115 stop:807 length:693 start_codon:yes stop_codon:yes gene_type:complete
MSLDENDINTKTTYIMKVLNKIDSKIEEIHKKIKDINHIYMQYEFNKTLKLSQTSSYLKFQVDYLFNEINYFKNIKKYFIKKFVDELYSISDCIILILISLDNLDIGYIDEKENIMKKIIKVTVQKNINSSKITELVNSLMNNLKLSCDFIELFNTFIVTSHNQNKKKNIHSNNFKINLMNKKNHFDLESNKYREQLNILISYFYSFSESIDLQLDKQKLLHFFISNKNI